MTGIFGFLSSGEFLYSRSLMNIHLSLGFACAFAFSIANSTTISYRFERECMDTITSVQSIESTRQRSHQFKCIILLFRMIHANIRTLSVVGHIPEIGCLKPSSANAKSGLKGRSCLVSRHSRVPRTRVVDSDYS